MPLVQRRIEPIKLSQKEIAKDVDDVSEAISNNSLCGLLRQLGSLVRHVDEIFDEIHNECRSVQVRITSLRERVENVQEKALALNARNVQVPESDLNTFWQLKCHFQHKQVEDTQLISNQSRSNAVARLYKDAGTAAVAQFTSQNLICTPVLGSTAKRKKKNLDIETRRPQSFVTLSDWQSDSELLDATLESGRGLERLSRVDQDGSQSKLPTTTERISAIALRYPASIVAVDVTGSLLDRYSRLRRSHNHVEYVKRRRKKKREKRRNTIGDATEIQNALEPRLDDVTTVTATTASSSRGDDTFDLSCDDQSSSSEISSNKASSRSSSNKMDDLRLTQGIQRLSKDDGNHSTSGNWSGSSSTRASIESPDQNSITTTAVIHSDGTATPDLAEIPFVDDETSSSFSCDTEGYYTSFHVDSGLKMVREESVDLSSPVAENEYELFGRGSTDTTNSSASTGTVVMRGSLERGGDRPKLPPPPPQRNSSLERKNKKNRESSNRDSIITVINVEVEKNQNKDGDSGRESCSPPIESENENDGLRVKTQMTASRIPSLCVITPPNSDDDQSETYKDTTDLQKNIAASLVAADKNNKIIGEEVNSSTKDENNAGQMVARETEYSSVKNTDEKDNAVQKPIREGEYVLFKDAEKMQPPKIEEINIKNVPPVQYISENEAQQLSKSPEPPVCVDTTSEVRNKTDEDKLLREGEYVYLKELPSHRHMTAPFSHTNKTIISPSNSLERSKQKYGARVTLDAKGQVVYSSDSLKRKKGGQSTFEPGPCIRSVSDVPMGTTRICTSQMQDSVDTVDSKDISESNKPIVRATVGPGPLSPKRERQGAYVNLQSPVSDDEGTSSLRRSNSYKAANDNSVTTPLLSRANSEEKRVETQDNKRRSLSPTDNRRSLSPNSNNSSNAIRRTLAAVKMEARRLSASAEKQIRPAEQKSVIPGRWQPTRHHSNDNTLPRMLSPQYAEETNTPKSGQKLPPRSSTSTYPPIRQKQRNSPIQQAPAKGTPQKPSTLPIQSASKRAPIVGSPSPPDDRFMYSFSETSPRTGSSESPRNTSSPSKSLIPISFFGNKQKANAASPSSSSSSNHCSNSSKTLPPRTSSSNNSTRNSNSLGTTYSPEKRTPISGAAFETPPPPAVSRLPLPAASRTPFSSESPEKRTPGRETVGDRKRSDLSSQLAQLCSTDDESNEKSQPKIQRECSPEGKEENPETAAEESQTKSPVRKGMSVDDLYAVIHRSKRRMNIKLDADSSSSRSSTPISSTGSVSPYSSRSNSPSLLAGSLPNLQVPNSRHSWAAATGGYSKTLHNPGSRHSLASPGMIGIKPRQAAIDDFKKLLSEKGAAHHKERISAVDLLNASKPQSTPRERKSTPIAGGFQRVSSGRRTPPKGRGSLSKPKMKVLQSGGQVYVYTPRTDILSSTIEEESDGSEGEGSSKQKGCSRRLSFEEKSDNKPSGYHQGVAPVRTDPSEYTPTGQRLTDTRQASPVSSSIASVVSDKGSPSSSSYGRPLNYFAGPQPVRPSLQRGNAVSADNLYGAGTYLPSPPQRQLGSTGDIYGYLSRSNSSQPRRLPTPAIYSRSNSWDGTRSLPRYPYHPQEHRQMLTAPQGHRPMLGMPQDLRSRLGPPQNHSSMLHSPPEHGFSSYSVSPDHRPSSASPSTFQSRDPYTAPHRPFQSPPSYYEAISRPVNNESPTRNQSSYPDGFGVSPQNRSAFAPCHPPPNAQFHSNQEASRFPPCGSPVTRVHPRLETAL